jgi:hypothetical protein
MERMGILAQSALYFAAPFLAKALGCNLYINNTTITDPYDLGPPVFYWPGSRINMVCPLTHWQYLEAAA